MDNWRTSVIGSAIIVGAIFGPVTDPTQIAALVATGIGFIVSKDGVS